MCEESINLNQRGPLERAIVGALKSGIDAHGPITRDNVGSAAKRVIGAIKCFNRETKLAKDRENEENHSMQIPKFKTMREQILACNEEELVAMAKGRALSYADSSRLEGLVLDQERMETEILEGYRKIRKENQSC